ncbi:MAG: Do family serine endopeptidase [Brumimicrobium sp.]|nr:Do family serine endopeptidase [Brumimicrobium sp.]
MNRNLKTLGLGLLGGLIPLGVYFSIQPFSSDKKQNALYNSEQIQIPTTPVNYLGAGVPPSIDFTVASANSVHSVVHVKTKVVRTTVQTDPLLEFFYGPGAGRQQKQYGVGSGSGVIVSSDGYIVTNNHVIQNASEIDVTLNDNSTYKAEVVGVDPSTDIAVIKIDAKDLRPMAFGNSDDVQVGQWVLAVGNPFNLTSTVTAGIVSAKARNINIIGSDDKSVLPIESFIQTDAAVNPGNSGGALVNTAGELVGINTAIASQTGSYAGYAFAVPSRLVSKIMKDLIDYGMVQRAFLGVQISEVNQQLVDEYNLPNTKGVYVQGVTKGSGAEKAKIKEGDVILKVGSKEVNSTAQLLEEIGKRRPGDKVALTVRRDGNTETKEVVLKNMEGGTDLISKEEIERHSALGATFRELSKDEKKELNIDHGVKISNISAGKLKALGLAEGMIITKMNNEKVLTVEQLTTFLNKSHNKGVLLEVMTESGSKDYVGFGL